MNRKLVLGIVIGCYYLSVLVSTIASFPSLSGKQESITQIDRIHNLTTGLNYTKIQEAIDANETQSGHTILVDAGVYYEHVVVNKSLTLLGENKSTTTIDGSQNGTVVEITVDNVTITGFTVQNSGASHVGIHISNNGNSNVSNNIIAENDYGVLSQYSANSRISLNNVSNNDYGFYFNTCNNNTVNGNYLENNTYALQFWFSSSNSLLENIMSENRFNFFFPPSSNILDFTHSIEVSNLVDGKPVYYYLNQTDLLVNPITHPEIGYLALVSCFNATVEEIATQRNGQGVLFAHTSNSKIRNCTFTNNLNGISLYSSNYNNVSDNNVTRNDDDGFELVSSHNNNVSRNLMAKNGGVGADLRTAQRNIINANNITENETGLTLYSSSKNNRIIGNNIAENSFYGIDLLTSTNNTISENHISTNNYTAINLYESSYNTVSRNQVSDNGIGLYFDYFSDYNSVSGNTIRDNNKGIEEWESSHSLVVGNILATNEVGIALGESSNNTFFHNNFVDNSKQVEILTFGQANFWDNNVEGNFWSNYTGQDSNRDGIGESAHNMGANNTDNYPLLGMFSSFTAVPGQLVNIISNSTITNFEYFALNTTVKFRVSNTTSGQTRGFCRVQIPHSLVSEPYNVTVEGGNPTYWNYTLYDDGENRWIYFNYQHSQLEVIVAPEFPSVVILPLFTLATLGAALLYTRKGHERN